VQALIHRHAQFEGDALRNVQPVQFVVEDVRQTSVELPSTSDDSSGGVQDPLQLVSCSSHPSASPVFILTLILIGRATHTQRDLPGDSMRRGQRTFPSKYYENRYVCVVFS